MAIACLACELILLAVLRLAGEEYLPDGLAITLILVFSAVFIVSINKDRTKRYIRDALSAGYIFRLALLFFDHYGRDIYSLPNSGADSEKFFRFSVGLAQGGSVDLGFFTKVMGAYFRVFGISRLYSQFILMLLSIVSLLFAAKILHALGLDIKRTRFSMWILCLLPNFAILSSIFLRESIVTMFITLSLYAYVLWIKRKKERHFLLALVFVFLGALFHSGAVAVAGGYALSRILYDNKTEKIKITAKNVIFAVVLLLVGIFLFNNYGDVFFGKFEGTESLSDIANQSELGGSSYAKYVGNSNNILNMVIYTVPRIVFFLFSPMPWMIRDLGDIIAFLFSSCFYLVSIISVIKYLNSKRKENREIVIVLFIVAICAAFVFAWGTVNAGTACRHRDKMTIVWGILLGLTNSRNSKNYCPTFYRMG